MNSLVPLQCPNCGAPLSTGSNIGRFSCGYCGKEYIADTGKDGASKDIAESTTITESIQALQEITARGVTANEITALELTLQRIQKRNQSEMAFAQPIFQQIAAQERVANVMAILGVLCLVAPTLLREMPPQLLCVLIPASLVLVLLAAVLYFPLRKRKQSLRQRLIPLLQEETTIRQKLQELQKQ